jgi:predicted nucleotidyltransferase
MGNLVMDIEEAGLIKPPYFLASNIMYLAYTGSVSYGCSVDYSDNDIVGITIPSKEVLFPHLTGAIPGFGKKIDPFNQWHQHHIKYKEKNYDLTIYNIVQYFNLCLQNNPNCLDYLFTDRTDIVHSTQISELLRENRKLFLHRGLWPKFKGYAYSELSALGKEKYNGSRVELVEKFGYDTKNGYQCVRLLLEAEQLLGEGDLDLKRNKEQLITIRNGEWTLDQLKDWCKKKEGQLEDLYHKSRLPMCSADVEVKIKELLLQCLEIHYGNLKEIERPDKFKTMVLEIQKIVNQ